VPAFAAISYNNTLDRRQMAIDIEITESMLMQDLDLSVRKLSLVREAVDRFSAGDPRNADVGGARPAKRA
jgi:hypothetical protein